MIDKDSLNKAISQIDADSSPASVLCALYDAKETKISYGELRDDLGLDASQIRVIAAALEDYGLANRIKHDAGRMGLTLYPSGEEWVEAVKPPMTDSREDATSGIKHSPAREFGHAEEGYAIEFNLGGFACRSLTVPTRGEAAAFESTFEEIDAVSNTEVVRDA